MNFFMKVPSEFALKYSLGEVVRYGTILKDAKTGFIVAHLRETPKLVDLVSHLPINPTQIVSSLIQSSSSLVANYQLYNQGIKIDNLTDEMKNAFKALDIQLSSLTELSKTTLAISSIGAVASIATFALCITQFKAINDRLNTIEEKTTEILNRLEKLERNNNKREIREYLSNIKASFDYLLSPSATKIGIESSQRDLSKGFYGLNNYLKHKIDEDTSQLNFEDSSFLFSTMLIAAMGEFRGFIILDDTKGADYILNKRMSDLITLNKYFTHVTSAIIKNNTLKTPELFEKKCQLEIFVNKIVDSCIDFDCQRLIVSEYLMKNSFSLKEYYEKIDIENDDLIKVVRQPNKK